MKKSHVFSLQKFPTWLLFRVCIVLLFARTTQGVVNAQTPGNVSDNLQLWLKANVGVTGTEPITGWSDQTGINTDAINSVGSGPDFLMDQINFNPALQFDNVDSLVIENGILGTASYGEISIYTVIRYDQTDGDQYIFKESLNSGQLDVRMNDTDVSSSFGNAVNTGVMDLSNESFGFWYFGHSNTQNNPNGTSKVIYNNGEMVGSSISISSRNGVGTDFILGDNFDGRIGEVIIYTKVPSSEEHEQIQTYLAIKYGITKISEDLSATTSLDERDYFASDASVIWDYSTNTSYSNDIIGITRDESGSLYRKQSKTQDDSLVVFVGELSSSNDANTGTITTDISSMLIGHNGGLQKVTATSESEVPVEIIDKVEREWQIVNTNFTDDFSIDVQLDLANTIDPSDLRLLIDDDGDFSNASVYSSEDEISITASTGRTYTVSNISNTLIPTNSTRYISFGWGTFTIDPIADVIIDENEAYTSVIPSLSGVAPNGDVTYTLDGADAASFTIDSGTGVVSMIARDYENPVDVNQDNVYECSIIATDEDENTASETWTISIQDLEDEAFIILSIDDQTWNENSNYTSSAPILSGGTLIGAITFTLGGADASSCTIDPNTGVVSMIARDFENPTDVNQDNVYECSIIATDEDENTASEAWTISIQDVLETVTFTIAEIADETISENNGYTSSAPVLDGDAPIGDVTYALEGIDASNFTIDMNTGVVSMVVRDFETPEDNNLDNIYICNIQATDEDGNTASEGWAVYIQDILLTISEIDNATHPENSIYTSPEPVLSGDVPVGNVVFSLTGVDAQYFSVNPNTGIVSMESRDFENPEDENHDNVYELSITAMDERGQTASVEWAITVVDVDETEVIIPNAFTPNGDNENDSWEIINLSDNSSIAIFDRNGTVLFQSVGYQSPWDGNYNGKQLPMDTYYYLVKDRGSQYKGYVMIIK